MRVIIAIAIGGAAGALARYGVTVGTQRWLAHFPLGTLAVNLVGCLLIGVCFAVFHEKMGEHWRHGMTYGFLGALTTFSTFGLDAVKLVHDGRHAHAAGYLIASVVAGIALVFVGIALGGWLTQRAA